MSKFELTLVVPTKIAELDLEHREEVLYIVHKILELRAARRDRTFVPLHYKTLRKQVGHYKTTPAIEEAVRKGIIVRDPSYEPGGHSMSYAISRGLDGETVWTPLTNSRMLQAITKFEDGRQAKLQAQVCGTPYQAVIDDLSRVTLELNEGWASTLIERVVAGKVKEKLPEVNRELDKKLDGLLGRGHGLTSNQERQYRRWTEPEYSDHLRACYRLSCEHMRSGRQYAKVDEYGRLHTDFTSLPNIFSRYIRIDGDAVGQVDISNSQPIFLSLYVQGALTSTCPSPYSPLRSYLLYGVQNEVREFQDLVAGGKFYERIQEAMRLSSRDEAKTSFFAYAYGRPLPGRGCWRFFEDHFPGIHHFIISTKRHNGLKEPHKFLAQEMQRAESDFVFNRVVPSIKKLDASIPLLSKHDSLLTTRTHLDIVAEAFREGFAKVGIDPVGLHVEKYDQVEALAA